MSWCLTGCRHTARAPGQLDIQEALVNRKSVMARVVRQAVIMACPQTRPFRSVYHDGATLCMSGWMLRKELGEVGNFPSLSVRRREN